VVDIIPCFWWANFWSETNNGQRAITNYNGMFANYLPCCNYINSVNLWSEATKWTCSCWTSTLSEMVRLPSIFFLQFGLNIWVLNIIVKIPLHSRLDVVIILLRDIIPCFWRVNFWSEATKCAITCSLITHSVCSTETVRH